jgi:hypothetical protein
MATPPRRDIFAQVIGFLVFLLGLGIILGVLWLAFGIWNDTNLGLGASKNGTTAADIGVGFGKLTMRIILLFLGSVSGSLIANKGIRLYFTGAGTHHGPAATPGASADVVTITKEPTEIIEKEEVLHARRQKA